MHGSGSGEVGGFRSARHGPEQRDLKTGMKHSGIVKTYIFLCLWGFTLAAPAGEWIYQVKPGDNLWDLAQKYLVSMRYWRPLQRLNGIGDPLHMRPGLRLRVPESWSRIRTVGARIVALEGEPLIDPRGVTPERKARPGEIVGEGDRLRTPAGSRILLEFSDGARLLLQSGGVA